MKLDELASPQIIDELGFEQIFSELKAELLKLAPEFSAYLESDPLIKLFEIVAYRELMMRQKINHAARENLLAFASGSNLDHLASFYGLKRKDSEKDVDFRNRIQAKIEGWSSSGSKAAYRYHALNSDTRVKEARADSPVPGLVQISILSKEDGGKASESLLKTVKDYINRDDIRMLTDTVEVISCNIIDVDVKAKIVLNVGTPMELVESIRENFTNKFNEFAELGNSISKNQLLVWLFLDGVATVDLLLPLDDISVGVSECANLKSLELICSY